MEYLERETLASRLMKSPLPTEHVLKYGFEICEGQEKAHKSGVIHRDFEPWKHHADKIRNQADGFRTRKIERFRSLGICPSRERQSVVTRLSIVSLRFFS